ncbi:FkbM family methyltransferase [Vreelandella aquamarina]|uniref:FkbM family methyltransferase n=1 Tax=Vreelandella aquamarina TaxID=77097 RepID=UPI003D0700DF
MTKTKQKKHWLGWLRHLNPFYRHYPDKDKMPSSEATMQATHSVLGNQEQMQLSQAKTHWLFGEWQRLVEITPEEIEHHPERNRLALLVAAAYQQKNGHDEARIWAKQALAWGCPPRAIAQVLISGVHNTLGRIAHLSNNDHRAQQHFMSAINVVEPQHADLMAHARFSKERDRLASEKPTALTFDIKTLSLEKIQHKKNTTGINSYAQNFEDVMLWRALGYVKNGFYIDIGAQDPTNDSVSKAFHEKGWSGIHVEPIEEYAEALRKERPGDKVVQAVMAEKSGEQIFYKINKTGLSTGSLEFAKKHQEAGWPIEEIKVPKKTLKSLFESQCQNDIHWLKIDVEGMESETLIGWGDHPARPWIIVVEATEPNSQTPTWNDWEGHLIKRGYISTYFDGLNKYYIHEKHCELKRHFALPPNTFDGFIKKQ